MERLMDTETISNIKEVLKDMGNEVTLLLVKNGGEFSDIAEELINEIKEADTNNKLVIDATTKDNGYNLDPDMRPAILILGEDNKDYGIRYYGIPSGHEFSMFLRNILAVSNKSVNSFTDESKEKLTQIDKELRIRVFVTPTCPYCPKTVFMAHQLAMLNPNITSEMIEANEFDDLSYEYGVSSVPHTIIEIKENGNWTKKGEFVGDYPENRFIEEIYNSVSA